MCGFGGAGGEVGAIESESVSFKGDDDMFVVVAVGFNYFGFTPVELFVVDERCDLELLGLRLEVKVCVVVILEGVYPCFSPSCVCVDMRSDAPGVGYLFELVGAGLGVVDLVSSSWLMLIFGVADSAVIRGSVGIMCFWLFPFVPGCLWLFLVVCCLLFVVWYVWLLETIYRCVRTCRVQRFHVGDTVSVQI